jgi:predicted FMN-binding regulatory protein PaiB
MFIPEYFRIDEPGKIRRFIEADSLGQLVFNCEGRFFSAHLRRTNQDDLASAMEDRG